MIDKNGKLLKDWKKEKLAGYRKMSLNKLKELRGLYKIHCVGRDIILFTDIKRSRTWNKILDEMDKGSIKAIDHVIKERLV